MSPRPEHDDNDSRGQRLDDLERRMAAAENELGGQASAQSALGAELTRIDGTIPERLVERFVKLETEFGTVRLLVYGFAAVILMAVAVALVALVVRK